MIEALPLVLLALASYRVTRFIVADSLTETPREALKRWAFIELEDGTLLDRPVDGHPWLTALRGKLGELLICPFCVSVHVAGWAYIALVLDGGWVEHSTVVTHLLNWVAIAGATVIIWNLAERAVDDE